MIDVYKLNLKSPELDRVYQWIQLSRLGSNFEAILHFHVILSHCGCQNCLSRTVYLAHRQVQLCPSKTDNAQNEFSVQGVTGGINLLLANTFICSYRERGNCRVHIP